MKILFSKVCSSLIMSYIRDVVNRLLRLIFKRKEKAPKPDTKTSVPLTFEEHKSTLSKIELGKFKATFYSSSSTFRNF